MRIIENQVSKYRWYTIWLHCQYWCVWLGDVGVVFWNAKRTQLWNAGPVIILPAPIEMHLELNRPSKKSRKCHSFSSEISRKGDKISKTLRNHHLDPNKRKMRLMILMTLMLLNMTQYILGESKTGHNRWIRWSRWRLYSSESILGIIIIMIIIFKITNISQWVDASHNFFHKTLNHFLSHHFQVHDVITFEVGQTELEYEMEIVDDDEWEPDEEFYVKVIWWWSSSSFGFAN